MKSVKKQRVMVLYGGKSGEHEISLRSAASVIRLLDRTRFEVVPMAIDKRGIWHLENLGEIDRHLGQPGVEALVIHPDAPVFSAGSLSSLGIDVVFPVMHGPLCEDGAIQGWLELSGVAYVGSGVLGSAVGMDKELAKRLAQAAGIPIVPFLCVRGSDWARPDRQKKLAEWIAQIQSSLQFPVFVKPVNLGSSVGVHKVKAPEQLESALEDAFRYDTKVLIEQAVSAREIEFAVLEHSEWGHTPQVSVPGEIIPQHEFYSYEAKYLDAQGAKLVLPAPLTPAQLEAGQKWAALAFQTLECEGLARVDFFLDRQTGAFYFNEVNTLPGFTSISMYPKMWEQSGLGYVALLSRLIDLAVARGVRKQALIRDYLQG